MIGIVFLDDNNGVSFTNKIQSQDRLVTQDILRIKDQYHKNLYITYSLKNVFQKVQYNIIDENQQDNQGIYIYGNCINYDILKQCSILIVYYWNRSYPSTEKFEWDKIKAYFINIERCEFPGYSHEKITKEIWHNETFKLFY